ncbi:hypothetical protein D3C86_1298520 [compost metagenome]
MTGHFAQHCAIATANNQHVFCVAVRQQRHVGHHFVIDKFVALGGLHHPVQRHHAPKCGILEDDQILMIGFLMIKHVINGKVLTKLVMQRFVPQGFLGHRLIPPLLTSITPTQNGRNIIANNDRACTAIMFNKGASGRLLHVGEQAQRIAGQRFAFFRDRDADAA